MVWVHWEKYLREWHRLLHMEASPRRGRLGKFYARCKRFRRASGEFGLAAGFRSGIELDQHSTAIGNGHKKEIDTAPVGSQALLRINRRKAEILVQDCRGAIDIGAAKLNLLNALPESQQKA